MEAPAAKPPVPVRTIMATIGLVLATLVGIVIVRELTHIIGLLVVSAFLAVVLAPAVAFLERHGARRSLATVFVFFLGITLIGLMLFTFIRPIAAEVNDFVNGLPQFVKNAREGRGTVGRLVQRYELDELIARNQGRLQEAVRDAGAPALSVLRTVANTVFALVTVLVLTFLMLLEGPKVLNGVLGLFSRRRQDQVRLVAGDCAKAVTGYMAGNLLISVIAGLATFVFLSLIGVPFAGVLGLWVAFADLIPLVGATLGAIPTVAVAFLASPTLGIATFVYYVLYQQFENHYLQVAVMSRTVDLNPLAVLVSVLVGVELFGVLGALLAIPAAGVLQVIARDIYDEHRGRMKPEPTVGADEVPVSEIVDEEMSRAAASAGAAGTGASAGTARTSESAGAAGTGASADAGGAEGAQEPPVGARGLAPAPSELPEGDRVGLALPPSREEVAASRGDDAGGGSF